MFRHIRAITMNTNLRFSALALCVAMGSALKIQDSVQIETSVRPGPRVLDPKKEDRTHDLHQFGVEVYVECDPDLKEAGQINGTAACGSPQDGWHKEPSASNHNVYGFIHIPKAAGSSFAVDSARFIPDGDGYYSQESCPAEILKMLSSRVANHNLSGMSLRLLTFLREPTAHVQSQYLELRYDPVWAWPGKDKFAAECPNISTWLDQFSSGAGDNKCVDSGNLEAYHPQDMQTRSLICEREGISGTHAYVAIDASTLRKALKNVDSYTFIGITEFYQASMCLFHDKVQPGSPLPDFCDCQDEEKWSSFPTHHISHSVPGHSLTDLSQEDLHKAAMLTENDARVYKAGLKRFYKEIRELEQRHGLRVHCE